MGNCLVFGSGYPNTETAADYFDNFVTKFIVINRTDALKTDFSLFFTITNCQIVCSRSLTHCINYNFMCLSAY